VIFGAIITTYGVAICHFHLVISLIHASYLKSGAVIPAPEECDGGIRGNSPPEKWPIGR